MLGHNSKMTGAECLADMLKGYGVTHVFHVPAVYEFLFVAPAIPITGAVGSPVNPLAIK